MTTEIHLGSLSDDSIKKMASQTTLDADLVDALTTLAQGNPGALTAMSALVKDSEFTPVDLAILQAAQLRGSDIWIGYKDICGYDIAKFRQMLSDHTLKEQIERVKSGN